MSLLPKTMYEDPEEASCILTSKELIELNKETDGWMVVDGVIRNIMGKKIQEDKYRVTLSIRV